jgi:hypothetical protein
MLRAEPQVPDLAIAETITAYGALVGETDAVDLPHIRLERSRYDHHQPWAMTAHPRPSDMSKVEGLIDEERNSRQLRIEGKTEFGERFVIHDTLLLGSHGRELRLRVDEIEYGVGELPSNPSEQYLSATLTPTNFAFEREVEQELSQQRRRVQGPLFEWSCSLGDMVLERNYAHERVRLNTRLQSVTVPEVWLHGSVNQTKLNRRPQELLERFQEELRWLLATLDLVDRRRTFWTDLRVYSRSHEDPAFEESAGRWRTAHPTDPPEYLTPFILPLRQAPDFLNRLAGAFARFEHRERLATAIAFMSSAHGEGYLEEHVMAAFAAFEAVVNGLPAIDDPDSEQIRVLQHELRTALDAISTRTAVSPEVVDRVRLRLAQLPDVPIARKAASLVEKHRVTWRDLWPGSNDLAAELRKALRIRNALFHTGHLSTGFAARPESERILVLTERLLFSAIGGASTDIYERAYAHIVWMLREIAELSAPASVSAQSISSPERNLRSK